MDHVHPGDCASIDQYISGLPGRLPNTFGKEPDKDQYQGGMIFVDHATQWVFLKHQVSLNAGKTVRAKTAFEQAASSCGVKIKSFRADNMPFKAKAFVDDLEHKGQTITYSGTGAHHQNGVTENSVRTITRNGASNVVARNPSVARSGGPQAMAIRDATRHSFVESVTSPWWTVVTRGDVYRYEDARPLTFTMISHVGLSDFCTGSSATRRKENSEVGPAHTQRTVPQILGGTLKHHWFDPKP